MVDAIVSYAVQTLGEFLIRQADLLHRVEDEVKWLQDELNFMRSFLKVAEKMQEDNENIRIWVSLIQDIAYDTQDVIETFIFKVNNRNRKRKRQKYLKDCFRISRIMGEIGKEIKALKERVLDVSRKRTTYGITAIGDVPEGTTSSGVSILRDLRALRITPSYADDDHVVGFDDDVQLLQAKLFTNEPRRSVISILGMGGLGKTTLARKLYNNNSSKFHLHAWVCVSQDWNPRDLLERLTKSFKEDVLTKDELKTLEMMKDYDMEVYLRKLLEERQYFVVIDDIWDIKAWESLRRALPDNKNGSRIIITTRIEAVAELSDNRTYVHKLRFLRPDESWELFCKKAFSENSGDRPQDMEKLGQEMVAKCDGLPLAIIVLGGLLSRKQFREWPKVKERIWRDLENDSIHISSLLDLSYRDLPHELKACFLYVGLFPEDFIIIVDKLIQLWIAEEFIPQDKGLDLEELAEIYLKELIGRSLIQVVKWNWRMVSTCRVHDLLRDLAVKKARELNFLHISDETRDSAPYTVSSSSRRIAFRSKFENYMSLDHSHQRVRTLSFLNNDYLRHGDYWNSPNAERLMQLLYPRFRSLRVLDLEKVHMFDKTCFNEVVGKLIFLRYLGLNETLIGELPESIGNLQALLTLIVSDDKQMGTMLPTNIRKLKKLRQLKGNLKTEKGRLVVTPLIFEELTYLRCLKTVNINGWLKQKESDEFALNAFAKLQYLQILSVSFRSEYLLSVEPLLNCRHLISLKINGGIKNLPDKMHESLPNLEFLHLSNSKFEQDPFPALEMLPNLLVLKLAHFGVKIMTATATGFPRLEVLHLYESQLVAFQLEKGAMPRLKAVNVLDSEKYLLPDGLRSLPSTAVLNWDWPNDFK